MVAGNEERGGYLDEFAGGPGCLVEDLLGRPEGVEEVAGVDDHVGPMLTGERDLFGEGGFMVAGSLAAPHRPAEVPVREV